MAINAVIPFQTRGQRRSADVAGSNEGAPFHRSIDRSANEDVGLHVETLVGGLIDPHFRAAFLK